jgi:hypothetical protein
MNALGRSVSVAGPPGLSTTDVGAGSRCPPECGAPGSSHSRFSRVKVMSARLGALGFPLLLPRSPCKVRDFLRRPANSSAGYSRRNRKEPESEAPDDLPPWLDPPIPGGEGRSGIGPHRYRAVHGKLPVLNWARLGTMNPGVAASPQNAADLGVRGMAALCRDAATGGRFMENLKPRFHRVTAR